MTTAKPITLLPAASLSGRVVYGPTGKPAAGIRVGAQAIENHGWGDAVTGRDGRYTMRQLPAGEYNVALALQGNLARSWTAAAHEAVSIGTGQHRKGLDFSLIHGAVIAGKVVAKKSGKPVTGIYVGVYGPAHPRSSPGVQSMEVAPDGSFYFRVPPGEQHLYLQNYMAPPGFSLPRDKDRDLMLRDGQTVIVNFELAGSPMQPIRGRVLDPDDKPVPGAEVVVMALEGPGERIIKADAQGRFYLAPENIMLRARHGTLATPEPFVPEAGGEVVLHLKHRVMASVAGLVTDAAGRPIAGAQVQLSALYGVPARGRRHGPLVGAVLSSPVAKATTDPQGRFIFSSLWPNQEYSVAAVPEGRSPRGDEAQTFELRPGEARELDPLVRRATASPEGEL